MARAPLRCVDRRLERDGSRVRREIGAAHGGAAARFPGHAIPFHALASDAIFAAVFAGWALVVSRATVRRSVPLFAAAGLFVGALALTRPGNQVLLLFALFPLVLHASWRWRLSAAAGFLVAGACVLALWAVHNGIRYGDYAVVRGSAAFIPFFRMYVSDHIVGPENGPASRKLARAVDPASSSRWSPIAPTVSTRTRSFAAAASVCTRTS